MSCLYITGYCVKIGLTGSYKLGKYTSCLTSVISIDRPESGRFPNVLLDIIYN